MVAVPVTVPELAVIVAVPAATPVTTPPDETVATDELLEDQVIEAGTIVPPASRAVAVRVADWPTFRVPDEGDTLIDAIGPGPGFVTVTVAVPD
jgi:hypothetical protein